MYKKFKNKIIQDVDGSYYLNSKDGQYNWYTLKYLSEILQKLNYMSEKNTTFNDYQKFAATTAIYPEHNAVPYCSLGLVGEAGEVANKVKKVIRDGAEWSEKVQKEKEKEIAKELSDCYWYLARLASELGYSSEEIIQMNIDKLSSRKERGTLNGDGDNR